MLILPKLYTLDITYFIPRTIILQAFIWQCEDKEPYYPRIHKFLNYWHDNIDAKIAEINIYETMNNITITTKEFNIG